MTISIEIYLYKTDTSESPLNWKFSKTNSLTFSTNFIRYHILMTSKWFIIAPFTKSLLFVYLNQMSAVFGTITMAALIVTTSDYTIPSIFPDEKTSIRRTPP